MKYSEQRRQGSGDEPALSPSLSLSLEGCIFGINPLLSVLIENTQRICEDPHVCWAITTQYKE